MTQGLTCHDIVHNERILSMWSYITATDISRCVWEHDSEKWGTAGKCVVWAMLSISVIGNRCSWGQCCQIKLTTFMRYSPALLTFTVAATPALTTVRAIFSIDEEVVVGFPGAVVTGFTVFKQTAASRRNKQEKGWKKSRHVGIRCAYF